LIELDRSPASSGTLTLYRNGQRQAMTTTGVIPRADLSTTADFTVGAQAELPAATFSLDYLRVARSTLAESETSIAELYAWETDGPHFADMAGQKPASREVFRPAGALLPAP
jgi:hypothetical protein